MYRVTIANSVVGFEHKHIICKACMYMYMSVQKEGRKRKRERGRERVGERRATHVHVHLKFWNLLSFLLPVTPLSQVAPPSPMPLVVPPQWAELVEEVGVAPTGRKWTELQGHCC